MSHIVEIQTEVRDAAAVAAACERLGLPRAEHGTYRLYGGEATGLGVQLPGWRYPVVCDLAAGQLRFDNFNGHWGAPAELNRFLQRYAIERASLEARKQGHQIREQPLSDGSVKLTIQIAG
jgi:hypothetical protein